MPTHHRRASESPPERPLVLNEAEFGCRIALEDGLACHASSHTSLDLLLGVSGPPHSEQGLRMTWRLNDWVGKMRDYPLLGIPVYTVFDPRTGTGAVLTDIHPTPDGPRYATRKDFVYGEDVTIGEWTIATNGLPCYRDDGAERTGSCEGPGNVPAGDK